MKSYLATKLWIFAETFNIRLPYPHIIFGWMIGSKPHKVESKNEDN